MQTHKLEEFQESGINLISPKLSKVNSVIAVSPTGSGKSVIISTIAHRFTQKSSKDVVIFVHKKELLDAIRQELHNWYGVISQMVEAKTKNIDTNCRIFVCMVETFDRRISEAFLDNFKNVGLLMIDECHLGFFKKIITHFKDSKRIGFTATPISAKKKEPLTDLYEDIAIIATMDDCLELNKINPKRGVIPCLEYALENDIDRDSFKTKGDDFDDEYAGKVLSGDVQISNTIKAYKDICYGKKAICFNANVEHSRKVTLRMQEAGLNARHIDGKFTASERAIMFNWFSNTKDAILNNVGIATIGTNLPSCEVIIINKLTKSLPLFKQMIGRGGRPYQYPDGSFMEHFILLDMCDNIEGGGMGRYADNIDWEFVFRNPKLPKPGISAVKTCPECGAMNSASARMCLGKTINWLTEDIEECNYAFLIDEEKEAEDLIEKQMRLIGESIDVSKNITFFSDRKPHFAKYAIYTQLAMKAKKEIDGVYLDSQTLLGIINTAIVKAGEWHKLTGNRKHPNFKKDCRTDMIKALQKPELGFIIPVEELSELGLEEEETQTF